jgi:hypothetical protein
MLNNDKSIPSIVAPWWSRHLTPKATGLRVMQAW